MLASVALVAAAGKTPLLRLKVSVVATTEITRRTVTLLRESGVNAEKLAMAAFLPHLFAARAELVVGEQVRLQGRWETLGQHNWTRDMLSRCKAHLQRDAKMRALGLTLRDESQKGQGVYYDGTGGLSRGQELGNLLDHAHAINRAEHAALERQQSDLLDYALTVHHKERGRLRHIGDPGANWLCMLNTSAKPEECNVECTELEAPPEQGSLEWANGWRGGERPYTARYVGDGGAGFLNLDYGDAF